VSPIGEPRSGAPPFIDSSSGAHVRRKKGGATSFELHEACAAWPEMTPADLRDLADDIAVNGLHEPITLTPDGKLLDGRNRALACAMAGVEPAIVIYNGDPWLFSLSKNKHRRHLTVDQVAMIAARLVKTSQGGDRRSEDFKTSNEGLKIGDAAKVLEVPKTAVESARVVVTLGTPEEQRTVDSGEAKVRKTADRIRSRTRKTVRPSAKSGRAHSKDPIDDVMRELVAKCSDRKWRSLRKMASATQLAASANKEALAQLGADRVQTRGGANDFEYLILRDEDARWRSLLAAKDAEIADLKRQLVGKNAEIAQLKAELQSITKPRRRREEEAAETPPSEAAP
jgi:hypothetical protein